MAVRRRPPVFHALPLTIPTSSLRREREALATAHQLNVSPAFNRDDDATRLDWEEFKAAMQSRRLPRRTKRVLWRLHPYFMDRELTLGQRKTTPSATGAKLVSFEGTTDEVAAAERILRELAGAPQWKELLAQSTVYISPEGFGIEAFIPAVPGSAGYTSAPPPEVWIAGSTLGDDRTLVHELSHALEMCTEGAEAETDRLWHELFGREIRPDTLLHPRELLAYGAEIYLSGLGEALREASPKLFERVRRLVGDVEVTAPGINREQAQDFINDLLRAFEEDDENLFFEVLNRYPPGATLSREHSDHGFGSPGVQEHDPG